MDYEISCRPNLVTQSRQMKFSVLCLTLLSYNRYVNLNASSFFQIYVHHGIHDLIFNFVGTLEASQVGLTSHPQTLS